MQTVPATLLAVLVALTTANAEESNKVCYPDIGCFSNDPPFNMRNLERPFLDLPESPDVIGTQFQLFSREQKTEEKVLDARRVADVKLVWETLTRRPVKFIVHGFLDKTNSTSWIKDMKDELLVQGDYHVIVVAWDGGNRFPYGVAAANTRVVGAQIAFLINALIKEHGFQAGDFHIIGHSLGAHIAGYAGQLVPGLARISGLSPAGPYFVNTDPKISLDPSDAKFVDVIHTDDKSIFQFSFGMSQAVGHLDFYPNFGHDQPGCDKSLFTDIKQYGLIDGVIEKIACSHERAITLYTESINARCPFLAYQCNSSDEFSNGICRSCEKGNCAFMGFNANEIKLSAGERRTYYLTTSGQPPFCQYHNEITIKVNKDGNSEKGILTAVLEGEKFKSQNTKLSTDNVSLEPGKEYRFSLPTASDLGEIKSVTIGWTSSSWFGFFKHPISVDEVKIYRAENDASIRFCAEGQVIQSDESFKFSDECAKDD